jgi:hypothetical protein
MDDKDARSVREAEALTGTAAEAFTTNRWPPASDSVMLFGAFAIP